MTRSVARNLQDLSAERLVAEDPRLTITQAAHIVDALRAGRSAAQPPAVLTVKPGRGANGKDEEHLELEALMRRILVQVVAAVPGAVGAAIRLADGAVVSVGDASGPPSLEVPFTVESKLEGSLGVALGEGSTVAEDDRRNLEVIASFAGTSLAAARSITDTVGAVIGGAQAGAASSHLIASVFGPTLDRHIRLAVAAERVRDVLDHLTTAFQPVVDLHERCVVGMEALTRFPPEPALAVDEWFRTAAETGMSGELEITALQTAFGRARELPSDRFLAINVSPAVAVTPAFLETVVDGFEPSRLVVEITEHAPVDDYRQLAGALRPLRAAGARLAIDDAGAGFASLRHVLRLSPDFIKLDLSLVHHIDADPVRRALATSLISFAREVGAVILAEGIETRFELETLVALGVRYGQGYHLGRPGELA